MGQPINPYAAGQRRYSGVRNAPNVGAVRDKTGYNERELKKRAQQAALQSRLQGTLRRRAI